MNNHQSVKAEVDAREENFTICVNLGKDLLDRKHYRSDEVREHAYTCAHPNTGSYKHICLIAKKLP
ncbi:hypothetical protein DPMN_099603 [Dreissena polymorpha]|uniref:Uncharacterized protein n=1 Tax=Dreissena polymorpha TaxID=45954 RepID=A0A9D4LHK4_DREPO|nr:hypothetical protein DPMN_099603 [Dreissena polymorpha]